jgi:hypothetical protein
VSGDTSKTREVCMQTFVRIDEAAIDAAASQTLAKIEEFPDEPIPLPTLPEKQMCRLSELTQSIMPIFKDVGP